MIPTVRISCPKNPTRQRTKMKTMINNSHVSAVCEPKKLAGWHIELIQNDFRVLFRKGTRWERNPPADMYLIDKLPPEVILQIAQYLDYDTTLALAKWVLNLEIISSSNTHFIILGLARGGERSWPKSRWKRGKRLLVSAEGISRQRDRPSMENGALARSAPSARKPRLRRGGARSWFCDTALTSPGIDANCAWCVSQKIWPVDILNSSKMISEYYLESHLGEKKTTTWRYDSVPELKKIPNSMK